MKVHVAAAVRRGSEGPSEGIRRIRRGFPEEEPSATAVCIDEGRGKSAVAAPSLSVRMKCRASGIKPLATESAPAEKPSGGDNQ